MHTAKIIRHRHKYHHYINDDLKAVDEKVEYKILFSDPDEMSRFEMWVKDNNGSYEWDKAEQSQRGTFPILKLFDKPDACWCDIFTYYLLHLKHYKFHSALSPYKGEIYIKE